MRSRACSLLWCRAATPERVDRPRPCRPRNTLYSTPISVPCLPNMEASTSSSSGTTSRDDMPVLESARPHEPSMSLSEDAEKRLHMERDLSKYPPTSHASSSAYMLDHEPESRGGFIPRRVTRAWNNTWRRVEARHPRVHRVGMWLWGPRPKVDLPRMYYCRTALMHKI